MKHGSARQPQKRLTIRSVSKPSMACGASDKVILALVEDEGGAGPRYLGDHRVQATISNVKTFRDSTGWLTPETLSPQTNQGLKLGRA